MSPLTSSNAPLGGVRYRRPRADLYTVLLALALVALVCAIVFLWMENAAFEWKYQGGPPKPAAAPGSAAVASPWTSLRA